jgi:hypothetical protein
LKPEAADTTSLVGESMRRIGDLLRDMGFNKDAPRSTQEAFFRHLLQNANATSAQNIFTNSEQPRADQQLSFDPEVLGVNSTEAPPKRVRSGRR